MTLAPEDRLIVALSRVCLSPSAKTAAAALLERDLDWNYIGETVVRHAVAPLFCHGLDQLEADVIAPVPGDTLARLRDLLHRNRVRNRRLYQVVGDIARQFSADGIAVVGLKDLQLAQVVYPDLGLRPIGDIDLLVRREQYPQVARAMARLDFVPHPSPEIPYTLRYAWAHHFRRAADNVWADVQWNVMQIEWDVHGEGNFDFEIDRMWRGAQPLAIDDYEILVPRPEDMLFHLCQHLEGHRYCELVLFCDIAEFLRHYQDTLDWLYLLAITKRYGVGSSLYYVLSIVRKLLDAPVPDFVFEQLRPAYFKAAVFAPLFQNLSILHASLDDLNSCAAPPLAAITGFETEVRRQAITAQRAYREIDDIASQFAERGRPFVAVAATSEKVLPDSRLRAFQPLEIFILERDWPSLLAVLQDGGYEQLEPDSATRTFAIETQDAAASARPLTLHVTAERERSFAASLARRSPESSKGAAARKLLWRRKPDPAAAIDLPLRICAFSPEEVVVLLATKWARRRHDRAFHLCTLAEFLRSYAGPLDWRRVQELAAEYGVAAEVQDACGLAGDVFSRSGENAFPAGSGNYRLLQSARYDPEETARHTGLKRSFYIVFTLLALPSWSQRLKYFAGLLRREWRNPRVVPALIGAMRTLLPRRQPRSAETFAYWIEIPPAHAPRAAGMPLQAWGQSKKAS